jgi:hypothetical protein
VRGFYEVVPILLVIKVVNREFFAKLQPGFLAGIEIARDGEIVEWIECFFIFEMKFAFIESLQT